MNAHLFLAPTVLFTKNDWRHREQEVENVSFRAVIVAVLGSVHDLVVPSEWYA